jgi:DNA repair photolyase
MEPRASTPERRLAAISALSEKGIPVGVMVAPVIPALNDHEIPAILEAAVGAGARYSGYVLVRLPFAVKELFEKWLEHHFPDKKEKVLNRVRAVRGGKLNDPNFETRMRGEGIFAEQIENLFRTACKRQGILGRRPDLSISGFRRLDARQLSFF